MNIIILKENYKVTCIEKSLYKIEFNKQSNKIINSLLNTKIILGGFTEDDYKVIKFKAKSVKTLKEYQNDSKKINGKEIIIVSNIAKIIKSLVIQLNYLIKYEFSTIIGYNIEDIIVINDEKFAFLGNELIANIDIKTNMIMITYPYEKNEFFISPELKNIKELPSYINYKTSYYSLAIMLIYLLLGDNEFYNDYLYNNNSENILNNLKNNSIKDTRIYWFLSRCLIEDVENRCLLLI
jgi:hypothetical protein